MHLPDIIQEIQDGSRAAQQLLFDRLYGRMLVLCCRYVRKREDAEELLLNGFLKIFRHLPAFRYQSDAAFFAWMQKLMVNECLMFLRKQHSFTLLAETAALEQPLDEDALDRLSAAEIMELVLQLPVGYRTVFNLYELEGYSHAEIAELLGISTGTSKSQLSKARALLQKLITQNDNYGLREQAR